MMLLQREYEKLPPIENLSINVQENIPMKRLGSVKHIVDCLGKINQYLF